ncbi:hypothetical protein CRYUN_Cryun20dG0048200 [Craigia yunnanensis]
MVGNNADIWLLSCNNRNVLKAFGCITACRTQTSACLTYSAAQMLRETAASPILKQHLDEALKQIFQYGQGGGIPRRSAPILQLIQEEVTEDGKYCLVLMFEAKALQLSDFEQSKAKFASFFGPGIAAEVGKGENNLHVVRLISNSTSNASAWRSI